MGWLLALVACAGGEEEVPETDGTSVGPTTTCPEPCPSEEICDGIDNDLDGQIDEGDSDGDGLNDCFDVEECDGLDNDGDGEVDEGFPLTDTDGDGIPDCRDVEECDHLDNNGDGRVDEGFDSDGDGVVDCDDVEECDGLDNDGDGLVDEDWGDVDEDDLADCIDPEECDHVDNDGDGLVDEDFPDIDGDGLPDCDGTCRFGPVTRTCTVDVPPDAAPFVTCDSGSLVSNAGNGWITVEIDLTDWDAVWIDVTVEGPTGFSVDLGNSPTCDGGGGDNTTTFWNEEFELRERTLSLYANELALNASISVQPDAVADIDTLHMEVCDGALRWSTSLVSGHIHNDYVFQLGGDEVDLVTGGYNDQRLYLGLNHVALETSPRDGTGATGATILLARAL
jgi:hypothetical protein